MSDSGSGTTATSNRKRNGYRECDDPEPADPNGTDHSPPDNITWRDRVAHFTWPWFACTMSTGAVAVVLSNTPNQFTGLQTIGKIFFILALVLFIAFTIIITIRFILVPQKFLASLHHPVESLFFGSYWVSISLLLNCIHLYGVPNTGPWLIKTLEILFWIYCAVVLIVGIGQYYILFQLERLSVNNAMPAWIFPIYPLLVVGPLASTLVPNQPHSAAVPIWIGGVMLQGVGWCVALMMYAIYTQRLMVSALPDPSTRPGMYVSVGPAGYTAHALISLGRQAPAVFGNREMFGVTTLPIGDVIKIIGILAGFFVILFSFWFFSEQRASEEKWTTNPIDKQENDLILSTLNSLLLDQLSAQESATHINSILSPRLISGHRAGVSWLWDINYPEGFSHEEWQAQAPERLNASIFCATLLLRSDDWKTEMAFHAHDAMREVMDGFDEEEREVADAWKMWIPPAVAWIEIAGEVLFKLCFDERDVKDDEQPALMKTFYAERWGEWKKRFEEMTEQEEIDGSCRHLVRQAAEKMQDIETRACIFVKD
ncbi:malic acid transporter [Aureobasidium subglaciale]|nr:malic acid transporter [Aureobasidium subglaciale]